MKEPPVVLPPLKLHKGAKHTYVFTYRGVWEPAVKDEAGNIIKKGRARSVDRKTVGKIDDGQHTGVIQFYDAFLNDYPELKNYIVIRNSDGPSLSISSPRRRFTQTQRLKQPSTPITRP